jgi:glycosyltransferase involved in cell wall biosynthesis
VVLPGAKAVPPGSPRHDGQHTLPGAGADGAWLPEHHALDPRRRYRPVPASKRADPGCGRARLPLCRARRGREESGGLPEPRSAWHEGRRRRRPARTDLERRYPEARFLGALTGEDLARVYASSDVFVFPSLTDTFGIVLIEALASGLPIAAFPVTGPLDVLGTSGCGVLLQDLREAALAALDIPKDRCRAYGETFTWQESARQFFSNIEKAHSVR